MYIFSILSCEIFSQIDLKMLAVTLYNLLWWLHLVVIPWARVVCLIYTPEARGPQARGLRVYISGKPRVHMV